MKSDQIIDKIRNKLKESDPDNRTVVNIFQFNFTDADGNLIKSMGEWEWCRVTCKHLIFK